MLFNSFLVKGNKKYFASLLIFKVIGKLMWADIKGAFLKRQRDHSEANDN